jgi:hypothetical protein
VRALLVAAAVFFVGCVSAPPLEEFERFKITARRGTTPDKHECIVTVECKNNPPHPFGRILVASEPQLVEGDVILEIKGWRGPKTEEEKNARERTVEAIIGLRTPSARFKFVLLDRGHRDEYTIVMPPTGEPVIEPAAGEFSERG